MKFILFLLLSFFCSLTSAAVPVKPANNLFTFQLHEVRLVDLMRVVYGDLLKKSFFLDAEFLGSTEIVSLDWKKQTPANVEKLFRDIINFHDFEIEQRSGVFFVRKKDFDEILIYRPQYRSIRYLTDIVLNVTSARVMKQPVFNNSQSQNQTLNIQPKSFNAVPFNGSLNQTINTSEISADLIVLNVQKSDFSKIKKLLVELDTPSGEIVLKAAVYEVGTHQGEGSAVQVVSGLLQGHIRGSIGATIAGANSIGYVNGGLDVILSLLDKDSRFKSVSRPMVRVRSGAQARFSVGQDVPVLGQATLDKNGNPVQSVDYRQSGVILTVTPDVHESVIDLDISQELSSFIPTSTGVNNSPTLLKRTVNSKLSIRPGEVVIFAGLNESKSDETESRFLGFKIGSQSNQGQTEILVFVEAERI